MSYSRWNKALTNYFFNDNNKDREVILYADKNLINDIGNNQNLGNYEDFIKCILIDFDSRCSLYDDIIAHPRRVGTDKVKINKELKNKIKEFPNHLSTKTGKFDLVFFNYIVFYITVFVDNTEDKSFYSNLNTIINKIIPLDNNTQPLNGLDNIFKDIEQWTLKNKKGNLGIFRARRIGALTFLGLLKYQVVLKPIENKQFEEVIYKYNIQINDNTLFAELANRLLPLVEKGSLRTKLIEATTNLVYAEWFLNRVKNFNHESFKNTEIGRNINVIKKGHLAFYIDPTDYLLKLKTNIEFYENDNIEDCYYVPSEKDENGYFMEPLFMKTSELIKFESKWINSNNIELKTLKINEVNFFQSQEISGGGYIQTLTPTTGYNYLIVVKENNVIKSSWEKWAFNELNVTEIKRIEKNDNLINVFGNNYIFYFAKDIKKSFYKNDLEDVIYSVELKDQSLSIRNIGGYQISNRTYIDTALPHFEIKNSEVDFGKLKVKAYRNGQEDKDIKIDRIGSKYYLFLNNEIYITESTLVIVKFNYDDKTEVQFDFSIVPSKIIIPDENQLFKWNKWGEKQTNEKAFFNGLNISNSQKLTLAPNKHKLEEIKDDYSFDYNYFIYILTSLFNYNKEFCINRSDINKAIDTALIYLRSKGLNIKENRYSKTNLVNNLYALGYINKSTDEKKNSSYQLMPPTIFKIEKSFDNNAQVYKLVGARTKVMIQKTIDFCNQKNIAIKFKVLKKNDREFLENILLPETIFIDLRSNRVDEFIEFIKDEIDIDIKVESQFHIGDSLVNFIASINDFEAKFLNNPFSLENQEFNFTTNNVLPCWVENKSASSRNGFSYFTKYLKTAPNTYFKDIPYGWANLYIEHKKKHPTLVMKKRYGNNNINFSREILIPTRIRLPLIIYKALVAFNHGIPKTVKVFVKDAKEQYEIDDKYYMLFDQYNISQKEGRQQNISKIITGSNELLNNPQIVFSNNNTAIKNKISFTECTLESDLRYAVIIKNENGNIIAIGTNYKKLFLNSIFIDSNNISKTNEININNEKISAIEIDISIDKMNKSISKILDDRLTDLKFLNSSKKLNIVTKNEEDIIIKELQ